MTKPSLVRIVAATIAGIVVIASAPVRGEDILTPAPVDSAALGTLADMAAVHAVLEFNENYCGPREPLPAEIHELGDLVDRLEPATIESFPVRDRWGNPLLVVGLHKNVLIWSEGPDGVADTGDAMRRLVDGDEAAWADLRNSHSDDLVVGEGGVLKGPESAMDRLKRSMADLRTVGTAVEAYAVDNGVFPPCPEGMNYTSALETYLVPAYLRMVPRTDAWGNPLVYVGSAEHFILFAAGSDGVVDRDYTSVDPRDTSWATPEFTDTVSDLVIVDGRFWSYPRLTSRY